MIDTVRLQLPNAHLDPDKLKRSRRWGWDRRGYVDATGTAHEWECLMPPRQKDDSAEPHYLRYMPEKELLVLEASLPKVKYAENITLLSPADLDESLTILSNNLCEVTGADIPHVRDWELRGRLDCVFAWDTRHNGKSHVADYLHAMKSVELPRHYCQNVDREQTLYWRNAQRVIRLYDKETETGRKEASGLLRFEVQLNHAKSELAGPAPQESSLSRLDYRSHAKHLMNNRKPNPKAGDILNWHTAHGVLENYLDAMGANLVIRDDEKLFQQLRENLTNTKAIRLIGYTTALKMFSRAELENMGYSRKTLWRWANEINRAGASVASSKSGLLPPLTLPSDDDYTGEPSRLAW